MLKLYNILASSVQTADIIFSILAWLSCISFSLFTFLSD